MSMQSVEDEAVWEAPDVTASEEHQALAVWLENAIVATLPPTTAVIGATFLVEPGGKKVSADILVSLGAGPGKRTSWRLPDDPVPDVTIEIISPSNASGEGRRLVREKRELYGRIGIPEHLELDPNLATIDVWVSRDGELTCVARGLHSYVSTRLGGLTIARDGDGDLAPFRPTGERFPKQKELVAQLDSARAEAASARVEVDAAQAEAEAARAEAEAARAEAAALRDALRAAGLEPPA